MKLKKMLSLALGIAMGFTCAVSNVEAGNIDTYKALLEKKTYTIRYVDITPEPRATNKDKIYMHGRNTMEKSQSHFAMNKQAEYIVVANGDNRYEEMGYGNIKQCRLIKDGETYHFAKQEINNGLFDIWGTKKGVVVAVPVNNMAMSMYGDAFGGAAMTRYLNAIMPNDYKSKDMPSFRYVSSGTLKNGLSYEDYNSSNGNIFEAVRYYFDAGKLVKIAAVQYWTNAAGVMEGTKTILKVNEFSPTPDMTYLELPKGVEDKTKREKKDEE